MKADGSSHRPLYRSISILLSAVAAACVAWTHPVEADDWSMLQNDAARLGCTETSTGPDECVVEWSYHQDGDRRFVPAAVVDGCLCATAFNTAESALPGGAGAAIAARAAAGR